MNLDLFKVIFIFIFTKVNHHQTTIWENILDFFQASNKQIQVPQKGNPDLVFQSHPLFQGHLL